MKRRCAFVVAVLYASLAAPAAHARPSTKSYTCGGLKSLIAKRGAVVMNTKSSYIYRRFVRHAGYCADGEVIRLFNTPTRTGQCTMRICEQDIYDDDRFRFNNRF